MIKTEVDINCSCTIIVPRGNTRSWKTYLFLNPNLTLVQYYHHIQQYKVYMRVMVISLFGDFDPVAFSEMKFCFGREYME